MQCEICGGAMWDNRENKKNPKGPDYKCKDKECGHAVWLKPKGETPEKKQPAHTTETGNSVTAKDRAMVMAYAKDLIVAQIQAGIGAPHPLKSIIWVFRSLWQEVERPGSVIFKEEA